MEDFGRRPDICIRDGNRVQIAIANPHRLGVTVAELRLLAKVDAAVERHLLAVAPSALPVTGRPAVRRTPHEHPLSA